MFKLENYATLDSGHRVNYVSMRHICTLLRSLRVNPASPILYWRGFLLNKIEESGAKKSHDDFGL